MQENKLFCLCAWYAIRFLWGRK